MYESIAGCVSHLDLRREKENGWVAGRTGRAGEGLKSGGAEPGRTVN